MLNLYNLSEIKAENYMLNLPMKIDRKVLHTYLSMKHVSLIF